MSERDARRRRVPGIRIRATAVATLVVAVTIALTAVVVVLLVRQSLLDTLDAQQNDRAATIVGLVSRGLPPSIPTTADQLSVVQVVDAHGTVVAATPDVQGEPPILSQPPNTRTSTQSTVAGVPFGQDGSFRVSSAPVSLASGEGWVYVAGSLASVDVPTASLIKLFVVVLPLALCAVGIIVWLALAAALRPVEQMRRRVRQIGATDLAARVPVPSSRDEIYQLATSMNEMLDRLETASLRERQFIADASHELRSPLAGLRAQIDVALATADAADVHHSLTIVHEEVERLTQLTGDLLFLAHAAERPPARASLIDLDDLVLEQARRLRHRGGRVLVTHIAAARVTGSRGDLDRLLRNIVDNAYDHSRTRIDLTLRLAGRSAEVTVCDDGSGIPATQREVVFDRFTRLDPTRSRTATGGGFGLGLSIARAVAVAHHGTIVARGRDDGGSGACITVTLPLAGA